MENKQCIGCGGELQNTDPKNLFYTPKSLDTEESILCKRCFRIRHYGDITPAMLDVNEYYNLVGTIAEKDVLVVKVLDAFDLEGSMMPQIHKITGNNDCLVIVNKRDLLPKIVHDNKLRHRIKKYLRKNNVNAIDVMFVSATKNYYIDNLIDKIATLSKGRDIYFVGATNVGKSTLINALLKASTELKEALITESNTRGTTQNFIGIPFENQMIYDTPGLFNKNHIANVITEKSYQLIQPKKEIKSRVYQLNPKQTLFLGGLARCDFLSGKPSNFIVYMAGKVEIHRRKLEGSDEFYETHNTTLLTPPFKEDPTFKLKKTQFKLKNQKTDIVIPGLAFITVHGYVTLNIYTPDSITPYQREALI